MEDQVEYVWKDVTKVKEPSGRGQSWEESRSWEHSLQSPIALEAPEFLP